ncbi:MAG: hypothetical protein K6A23_13585 [Butyrivibrio sp.]|nr:hypothetical protein [Butyrivibrio sp.]
MEYTTKFAPYTDEIFKAESKTSLLTNTDFDWSGAHSVKVWKMSTVALNDYARRRTTVESTDSFSRYGELIDLDATTEEMLVTKDRSFIFNIDALDTDETGRELAAASALAREVRNVVIPEIDTYVYAEMAENAGTIATPASLTKSNIYDNILTATQTLDDNEVPETGRVIVVTPTTNKILKQAIGETAYNNIDAEMRALGVVAIIDGMPVVKVPASRLPENFGFMVAHPCATVAPIKLEKYSIHEDTPLSSGAIVTGRIVYDAFVLDNKKNAIYYHALA